MAPITTNESSVKPGESSYGDFLQRPASDIAKRTIDFSKSGLPEYDGYYAVILDNVLSPAECQRLVRLAEESAAKDGTTEHGVWQRAMVNIGNGNQIMSEDMRKCGRIIFDSQDVAGLIWARVRDAVPELQQVVNKPDITGEGPTRRREVWKVTRLNERMRFLKYTKGEYFRAHQDGMYETPDKRERTYYTLHLYLNEDTPSSPLEGGATTFHSCKNDHDKFAVEPKMGSVLIFQQRWLYHAGSEVFRGTKLTMRTELMYEKSGELAPEPGEGVLKERDGGGKGRKGKEGRARWVRNKLTQGLK